MIRKILVVAAAAAMPVTAIAATGTYASAATPKVNATHYTVNCTSIAATASFAPALTNTATAPSNESTSIAGVAKGCTATPTAGGTPVTVSRATISGTIHSTTNHTCSGLNGTTTETGSLTVMWQSTPLLTSSKSVVNPTSVTGGVGGNGHATFALSYRAATSGPFQGTDKGKSSSTTAETGPTAVALFGTCGKPGGLKSLAIKTNANTTSPAIHAG